MEMNNWTVQIVKHWWKVAIRVLHQKIWFVSNTTAYHFGWYEPSSPSTYYRVPWFSQLYLCDAIAAPPGIEAVVLTLHFNVGPLAVHGVGGAEVVERDQEMKAIFGLKWRIFWDQFTECQLRCFLLILLNRWAKNLNHVIVKIYFYVPVAVDGVGVCIRFSRLVGLILFLTFVAMLLLLNRLTT